MTGKTILPAYNSLIWDWAGEYDLETIQHKAHEVRREWHIVFDEPPYMAGAYMNGKIRRNGKQTGWDPVDTPTYVLDLIDSAIYDSKLHMLQKKQEICRDFHYNSQKGCCKYSVHMVQLTCTENNGGMFMKGKSKCKILKEIRRQIARDNDIEFVTSECKYQGDCSGTCPKCEAEVRYLEEELAKRQNAGKKVAVAGIAAAFVVSSSGCTPEDLFSSSTRVDGDMMPEYSAMTSSEAESSVYSETEETAEMGELVPEETEETLMGDMPMPE